MKRSSSSPNCLLTASHWTLFHVFSWPPYASYSRCSPLVQITSSGSRYAWSCALSSLMTRQESWSRHLYRHPSNDVVPSCLEWAIGAYLVEVRRPNIYRHHQHIGFLYISNAFLPVKIIDLTDSMSQGEYVLSRVTVHVTFWTSIFSWIGI